nr:unnamed protein product [Callosobruchus chinensis]
MARNELSPFDRSRIIALWQEGLSRHHIANRLNVVRSTVTRTIRRYEETGEVNSRSRTSRPTVSTRREDRYIAQLARRERSVTVPVLISQFQRTFNRVISTATISRRVLASGLRCKRPLRVPLLTANHTTRLQWARAHQDWLLPQWRNVLFSDESRFGLISATMTGAYYLQNIINAIVRPLRNEIADQFIFMDDNARPHRTRAVQQALENGNIARLEWPAMSPDMRPIELVWDYV